MTDSVIRRFGTSPEIHGEWDLGCEETLSYLYLPVSMAGSESIRISKRLHWALPVVKHVMKHTPMQHYVYVTAKRLYVQPGYSGNRPGWHGDGFGTEDINWVWYDRDPTRFCIQDFDISDDHVESMRQFEEQVDQANVRVYPNKKLLRLDQYVVHEVPEITEHGFRTFLKVSTSAHKYNLKGNSHNHEFDYDWVMHDRAELRNNPVYGESDFVAEVVGDVT